MRRKFQVLTAILSNTQNYRVILPGTADMHFLYYCGKETSKVSSSSHLCVECFSQLSFDLEVYTKSAAVADFVYTSE